MSEHYDKSYYREKSAAWRKAHPEARAALAAKASTRNKEFVNALKKEPCTDCGGVFHPCQMDFDHLDASTKKRDVGSLANGAHSLATIQTEIDKCELVCSNCHRLRTYNRLQTQKKLLGASPSVSTEAQRGRSPKRALNPLCQAVRYRVPLPSAGGSPKAGSLPCK